MILTIEMPREDVTHSFTDLDKAIKFCKKEFGFKGSSLKQLKKAKDLAELKELLWYDGLWVEIHND